MIDIYENTQHQIFVHEYTIKMIGSLMSYEIKSRGDLMNRKALD